MAVRRLLVAGRYRLHEPVGAGGMGRVWLARDEMLDRDVAVKEFVPPEWIGDAERDRLRDRTLREARSAARLSHPHVVRIYDVVHTDDLPWIVMEYVDSRSLHQVITEDGPLAPAAVARVGLDVLDALTAAHRAGVLHRDVKPHNVLMGHDGRVVLTDFGLATFVEDGPVTGPGLIVGSPQYVSPERARDGASTVEADLWSLGATLYSAVEGRSPYARGSAMATLMALATEPPRPPVLAGPLEPVLTGLLRHDPAARLSPAEIESELRAVAGSALRWRTQTPRPRTPGDNRRLPGVAVHRAAGRASVPPQRPALGQAPSSNGSAAQSALAKLGLAAAPQPAAAPEPAAVRPAAVSPAPAAEAAAARAPVAAAPHAPADAGSKAAAARDTAVAAVPLTTDAVVPDAAAPAPDAAAPAPDAAALAPDAAAPAPDAAAPAPDAAALAPDAAAPAPDAVAPPSPAAALEAVAVQDDVAAPATVAAVAASGAAVALPVAGPGADSHRAGPAMIVSPADPDNGPAAMRHRVPDRDGTAPDVEPWQSRYRLALAGVLLVALLAGGGVVLGWLVQRDGTPNASPVPSSSAPASVDSGGTAAGIGGFSPSSCDRQAGAGLRRTPLPGAFQVATHNGLAALPGWSYHRDISGFVVAVPDGWTYERVGTTVCFADPRGVRVLSIDTARRPTADPVVACRREAQRLARIGALPRYAELGITRVPYLRKAADWEYRYNDARGDRMHAVTRWFTSGGKAFALGWVTAEFDWQVNHSVLDMILSSFDSPA
jgi:tRNA A-37 threonylcarbamoyl transferase component Bud32